MAAHQTARKVSPGRAVATGRRLAARRGRKTVRSMTGYAHRSEDTGRPATVELRSVNSRFTDLQFRLGDDLRALEPMLREQITAAVSRGKIECRLSWRSVRSTPAAVMLDEALLEQLLTAERRIRARLPDAAPLTVAEILRFHETATEQPAADGRARICRSPIRRARCRPRSRR